MDCKDLLFDSPFSTKLKLWVTANRKDCLFPLYDNY